MTAQAGGLAGVDTVTLYAPGTTSGGRGGTAGGLRELASFTTTATASPAASAAAQRQAAERSIDACAGGSRPLRLADGTTATTCPTVDGAAVDWAHAGWTVQVVTLDGTTPATGAATLVDDLLRSGGLPPGASGGFVSVVVPGNPSAGTADTADVQWSSGADEYTVRTQDDPSAALAVAAAMRPYPAG